MFFLNLNCFLFNRIRELEKRKSSVDESTQTIETKEADSKEELEKEVKLRNRIQNSCVKIKKDILHTAVLISQAAAEVENMKSQMMTLFKELQQAQSKLDEAEGMKKNLQDRFESAVITSKWNNVELSGPYRVADHSSPPIRCRDLETDVTTAKAQLGEKQSVQSENDRLKLQIDSVHAQIRIEQKKAAEDR